MKGILKVVMVVAWSIVFALGASCIVSCGPDFAQAQSAGGAHWSATINWTTAELTGSGVKVRKCVNTLKFQTLDSVSVKRSGGGGNPNVDLWVLTDDEDGETTTRAIHLLVATGIQDEAVLDGKGVPYAALKVNGTKRQTCVDAKGNGGASNLEVTLRGRGITTMILGAP